MANSTSSDAATSPQIRTHWRLVRQAAASSTQTSADTASGKTITTRTIVSGLASRIV